MEQEAADWNEIWDILSSKSNGQWAQLDLVQILLDHLEHIRLKIRQNN